MAAENRGIDREADQDAGVEHLADGWKSEARPHFGVRTQADMGTGLREKGNIAIRGMHGMDELDIRSEQSGIAEGTDVLRAFRLNSNVRCDRDADLARERPILGAN